MQARKTHSLLAIAIAFALAPCGITGGAIAAGESQGSIERISRRSQLLPGPWAYARFGDWRISTGDGVIVVADAAEEPNSLRIPGSIIDIGLSSDLYDGLGSLQPVVFVGDSAPKAISMETAALNEDKSSLSFQGGVEDEPGLKAKSVYSMPGASRVVRLTTTVTNASDETVYNLGVGDSVTWGLLIPMIEGFGVPDFRNLQITYSGWVGGAVDNCALGIVVPNGSIEASHQASVSALRYNTADLEPGQSATVVRDVYVGGRDFSKFTDYALECRNQPRGIFKGTVIDAAAGGPLEGIEVPIEARINEVQGDSGAITLGTHFPYTVARSGADGAFSARLPAGARAFAWGRSLSRRYPKPSVTLAPAVPRDAEIKESVTVVMAPPSTLSVKVEDSDTGEPLPCKIQILHILGGDPVNYGPSYQARGARNMWYLPSGEGKIPFPHRGRFQIRITRGPEYSSFEMPLNAAPGVDKEITAKLKRQLDTRGYLAVDFGVQTEASYNSRVSARDLVVAAAGEGVEWIVSGDINKATDLKSAIEQENLGKWIGSSRGMRIMPETRDLKADFSVFPVDSIGPEETFQAPWLETAETPESLHSSIRKAFPSAMLSLNTPMSALNGYFEKYKKDIRSRRLPEGEEVSLDFDMIQVLDGRSIASMDSDTLCYHTACLNGKYAAPIGASSSLEIYGNEPGYPRTYVAVPNDDPAQVTEEQILASLRQGDVVASTGPFIRFQAQGKRPGELAAPVNSRIDVELEVWASPFSRIDSISIYRDNQSNLQRIRPPIEDPLRFPLESKQETKTITLDYLTVDVALHAVARGWRGAGGLFSEINGRNEASVPTYAISGPVFIDGDGDGKYTPPEGKARFGSY